MWRPVSHTSAFRSLPLAGCYSWSTVRCKRKAHTSLVFLDTFLGHIMSLTLKADRSISSRLRAGESLAMMEDTHSYSPFARYPETAFAVTTVWSPLLLQSLPPVHRRPLSLFLSLSLLTSLSDTVMSPRQNNTSPLFWSAAGRACVRERTARARTPCTSALPGPCLWDVDGTGGREGEAPQRLGFACSCAAAVTASL